VSHVALIKLTKILCYVLGLGYAHKEKCRLSVGLKRERERERERVGRKDFVNGVDFES
jgi:hypothetical protein